MAVSISAQQMTMTIDDSKVNPFFAMDSQQRFLFGHLTEGWSGTDWVGDALTCTASVPVSGPQGEVDKVELGFVQIARATTFQAFYGGRIQQEGGIGLNYFVPPALSSTILLDGTKGARDPWYRNPLFSAGKGVTRSADFGDHPGMSVYLKLQNRLRSNVPNYLFHAFMEREFWTIFTALEPGKSPNYIGYFQWKLRYEFKIQWVRGSAQLRSNQSSYSLVKGRTVGKPPEAELATLLSAPAGERANAIGTRAEATTVTGNPPNREDLKIRFVTVPEDFWI